MPDAYQRPHAGHDGHLAFQPSIRRPLGELALDLLEAFCPESEDEKVEDSLSVRSDMMRYRTEARSAARLARIKLRGTEREQQCVHPLRIHPVQCSAYVLLSGGLRRMLLRLPDGAVIARRMLLLLLLLLLLRTERV